LVDDEIEMRKGIAKKIEWSKFGFNLAGEAENGREALELAEKIIPDIVITDIKMPFMDGIKFLEKLRKSIADVKVVILTGFDEFEYAKEAIKLNVDEYVLKPISANDLIQILLKLKRQLDEEIAQKENIEALKNHYVRSMPILKEKFFSSLITNKMFKSDIEEKCRSYNINLEGIYYTVAVVNIDENKLLKYRKIRNLEESEIMKYAVLNIVNEVGYKHGINSTFMHNDKIVLLISKLIDKREVVISDVLVTLEEIRQSIEKYLKITVTIGLGTIENDVTMLQESFRNAITALDYRLILGSNRVIWIEDIEPNSKDKIIFDESMEHYLESSIKVGTKNELSLVLDEMFHKLSDGKASFKDYQVYLLGMLTSILKAAQSSNVDLAEVFGKNINIFVELYELTDLIHVKEWFKNIAFKIMNYIAQNRKDSLKFMVEKAQDYIRENYKDSDININDICTYLHISQTYFSLIFKRETKTTFINYLTAIRMEEAKKLLKTTDMKTLVIARLVGYSEPNYFSYCFKKFFCMSPSEYRNKN
jgi:two-component system response regulator YesN